ncbi:MAG: bifunctional D-glycero-beta-D-manno-heptose-7-phosphate kinase/D-glycero-beta-D-manno-heptose 1-phosphate adenylyltransferase HldE [Gammaproteobacteria bacterium]|nr:bifunctional D-glycero-beta-D-manno-heptose-7-phosphate kinase/D-glycero-beta-D-manno-heptose 1-phosphate adenylyltransferase HldE [Gammaproteobacteria bacterium]
MPADYSPLMVPDFRGKTVLVAGDVMLDRYWLGPTERISPEAPVAVVHVSDTEERAGGAGNVAANLAALGIDVRLLGVRGKDEAGERLSDVIERGGITADLVVSDVAPTITKLRVMSRSQQLIRLDFEKSYADSDSKALSRAFSKSLPHCDLVVLSDYAKGTLADPQALILAARKAGVPVVVDPKGADFSLYRGAALLTPNRSEFERVAGVCPDESELAARARAMVVELELDALLVTLGERGMLLVTADGEPLWLAAEAREVFDVTGAGDTVIAVMAAGLVAGLAPAQAAELANTAAGLVVAKRGTASVSESELRLAAHRRGIPGSGIVMAEQARKLMDEARAQGQKVVMTNGCFDILHAGHVAYLAEARSLGDRLIVAVNDDASVRRLKGAPRPLNTLADRMAVLASLSAVDWVVAFSDDTPAELVCELLPDVLVKGGDYEAHEVAGGDCVKKHGGEVRILPLRAGRSTSRIVEAIKQGA